MSPLKLAALELKLASVAGERERHCAIRQDDFRNEVGIDIET